MNACKLISIDLPQSYLGRERDGQREREIDMTIEVARYSM